MAGCAVIGLLIFGAWSLSTLEEVKVNGPIYQKISLGKDLMSDGVPPALFIRESFVTALLLLNAESAAERDKLKRQGEELRRYYETSHIRWEKELPPGPLRDVVIIQVHEPAEAFFKTSTNKFIPALERGDHQEANRIYQEELSPLFNRNYDAIQELVRLDGEELKKLEKETAETIASRINYLLWVGGITILLLLLVSWRVGGSIVTPLQQTVEVLEAVEKGDYGQKLGIEQADEVGRMAQALNAVLLAINGKVQQLLTVEQAASTGDLRHDVRLSGNDPLSRMGAHLQKLTVSLRQSIGEISHNADGLSQAAGELRTLGQQMRQGSEDSASRTVDMVQASSRVNEQVITVASATEELSASIREIASAASSAAAVVDEAVDASTRSNVAIGRLVQRNDEIGSVLGTISSLARQTNLLALNAGIEAARAGTLGQSFMVVANEVKNLSRSTSQAADGIAEKISAIQADVADTVESVSKVIKLIEQINFHQQHITSSVSQQSDVVNQIAQRMGTAAQESDSIQQSLRGFQTNMQTASAQTREMAQASEQLSQMSMALSSLVQRFQV
ncbi:MAG: methyl-accepting chemotaxis protein [Myxococcota bacterium]